MKRFIRELRRREVFRTAGLYIGVCWILIEASSVFLPTFDAPDWVLRWIIIAVVVGFPVMLVLAWIYDVSARGIEVQGDATDTVIAPLGSRKMDFIVIGLLSVALIFSVYLNVTRVPGEAEPPKPLSVLIADFDNRTGNPLFDGSLEQALNIGIEGASFITAFSRPTALSQAKSLELGDKLDENTARLVSVRQDVRMVLAGSIEANGSRFDLTLRALDPTSGELVAEADARAAGSAEVLGAINELAADIRKELGDNSEDLGRLLSGETVTAASVEAIKDYTTAQDLARAGQDEEAITYYQKAVAADPELARAYSGWALSAFKIGRTSEAEEQWQKALSLMDRMTERERYRTLGLYYTAVSLNYDTAIDNYEQLVAKFPADGAGNNNLAILYTFTAQFDKALAQSEKLLEIYPGRTLYHGNHAQYAVYAGDMVTAAAEVQKVLAEDPTFFKSYMIMALVSLHDGDVAAAKSAYERMAETGVRGASLANIGLADIALFEERHQDAIDLLAGGIEADRAENNERGVATKTVALAQAQIALGDASAGVPLLDGINGVRDDGVLVPSAEIYAAAGRYDDANAIAEDFRKQLRPTARAYAGLIDGINAIHQGEYVIAIDALRKALAAADLWIVRYYLAQAFLAGGYPAEASGEFENLVSRRSEAGGMFFDDVPTWRYTASLDEWRAKAADAISNLSASANH
ncbi:MAG: tetratricopeptide repeat protein [Gammaproteobacteria bacterium]|nr:tetratricopeptide repeat protein [Gammaproteobacteria bacterium]